MVTSKLAAYRIISYNQILTFFSTFPFPYRRLCNDLQQLIQERADIEKSYAKNLRGWSKKWGELIEKGNIFFSL